ncbi:MAG: hypothetical protein NPIRA05_03840 [Nitrospirales bacterium]|nr:MAG: hypothetical protein NPIRA05_03840 [Nitrospirales bacterium]
MKIEEVRDGDTVLARHIPASISWAEGLNFFSEESEFIQVGTWGYQGGKELLPHSHNKVEREVDRTQEVLFVRKGALLASVYNLMNEKVREIRLSEGDIIILLSGGHGYEILEDETQVLEIKNGPYAGADVDRTRL